METRRLKAFVQIVDAGSLSRAAAVLGLAQPALSQQLADMERHFNAQLLVRSHRGVSPTPAGLRLYQHAQIILQQVQLAEKDVADSLAGIVRVGMLPTLMKMLLPHLVRSATTKFPSVRLDVQDEMSSPIKHKVFGHLLDIGLSYAEGTSAGLIAYPVVMEQLYLTSAAEGRPLLPDDFAEVQTLSETPLILPSERTSHRKQIDELFSTLGVRPRVIAEIDSLGGLLATVHAGIGAAILSSSAIALNSPVLRQQPIQGLERKISIFVADPPSTLPGVREVLDLLRNVIEELVTSGAWRGATLLPAAGEQNMEMSP